MSPTVPKRNRESPGLGLCRDCYVHVPAGAKRCPACGGRRLLFHDDLWALSIGHLDCDAFYASVEKRDHPELRDKPLIIGGGKRGVVSTACYIARLSGVRSAMPMFKALKACPEAVVMKPDMAKYARVAREIRTLMERLTPLVQPLSLDEAFLDLSGTERLHGAPPAEMLARLVGDVEREVGITASVGLSHNKFLAKVASDLDKPRGFTVIGRAETVPFLAKLPVRTIWGVGPAFAKALAADGITMISHIQKRSEEDMLRRYGSMGAHVWRLAHGIDARVVHTRDAAKSVSSETTFNEDIRDLEVLSAILWRQCERVARRAKTDQVSGRVVTLKLKTPDFKIRTRRRSLDQPTQMAHVLYKHGRTLLEAEADGTPFRLLGIGISELTEPHTADLRDLLNADEHRHSEAERTMDAIRGKFGKGAIGLGRGMTKRDGE